MGAALLVFQHLVLSAHGVCKGQISCVIWMYQVISSNSLRWEIVTWKRTRSQERATFVPYLAVIASLKRGCSHFYKCVALESQALLQHWHNCRPNEAAVSLGVSWFVWIQRRTQHFWCFRWSRRENSEHFHYLIPTSPVWERQQMAAALTFGNTLIAFQQQSCWKRICWEQW